ncbi:MULTISPECIES: alkaline shock response membrane anchor protein AmaP [Gordonibacter]|uniref:Alkaline shock response membrane anchor protein AmaP n=1 Tax=Gordonibacter faecis TaxID=3047475 RepID=A0ABT7DKS3_9ACTN|nr:MULTISPECIES: alkaline shock response membrane anchor protein AmaP [unclassified Gordonibacter]MDJ1650123.1 alkaline shock response membrane anchor protein AmaP [Gordonibacter sp. KGMB12511]
MGKFKRFCMIVFVVAAVLGIGVLAALWFAWEPLFPAIAWLMSMPWFYVVEAVLLGITAVGLLVVLIRALTAPGKNAQLELERDNGSVAITQNAIQSTVKHVVDSHHGLATKNVKVDITNKHDPRMAIHAKIDPGRNAELGELGAKLQDEIAATLEAFTGYPVDSVRITFAGDADVVTPAFTQQATKYSEDTNRQHHTQPVPAHAVTK